MKFLRKWMSLRYRLRSRRWRFRALAAEAKVRFLEMQLRVESDRNREREDSFVSATVMGSRGMFGVAPRTGSAMKQAGQSSTQRTEPWDGLSYAERNEFDMFWKKEAEAAGIPIAQAKQQFMIELASRKQPLNDDFAGMQ